MTLYNKEIKRYNIYSHLVFGKPIGDILKNKSSSKEEKEMAINYRYNSFFLDNGSVGNQVCNFMRSHIALIDKTSTKRSSGFDYSILTNPEFEINAYLLEKMKTYLEQYISFKRGFYPVSEVKYENLEVFIEYLRKLCFSEISSNESELINYAVELTYGGKENMVEFAWRMFPDGVIQNIIRNSSGTINFPIRDESGEVQYLWNRYTFKELELSEIYED
jgi:hypothetical protein